MVFSLFFRAFQITHRLFVVRILLFAFDLVSVFLLAVLVVFYEKGARDRVGWGSVIGIYGDIEQSAGNAISICNGWMFVVVGKVGIMKTEYYLWPAILRIFLLSHGFARRGSEFIIIAPTQN